MSLDQVPEAIADEMVKRLFADRMPDRWETILYPGCGDGVLIDAVYRYCDENGHTSEPPEGTAIDTDATRLRAIEEEYGNTVQTIQADFLTRQPAIDDGFEYIICNPPTVAWEELSQEEQRAYATNFAQIIIEDETVDEDVLFFEQALRYLAPDGRAVFITPPDFKTEEHAASFRDHLYYRVQDVIEFDSNDHPDLERQYIVTVVSNETSEETALSFRYDPTEYESMLATRIEDEHPFTAAAIMTESPEGYHPTTSIAEAFLDLLYNSYDAAPVYQDPATRSGVIGFISRESIQSHQGETVAEQCQELTAQYLLSPLASLPEVINRLEGERFQFVGDIDTVEGIITRFDLNRLPIYLHLYDCFSEFEIGLRELIRTEVPDWQQTTDVYVSSRPNEHLFTDRLACAKLGSLIDIVEAVGLERSIQPDLRGYETTLSDLKSLRDTVAHYNPILHTMSAGSTADSVERGARQFAREYRFLQTCIDGLIGT